MTKKISISITDKEYDQLLRRATTEEVSLDEYIQIKLFEDQSRGDITNWVIKELNNLIQKINTGDVEEENPQKNRLIIYSYIKYNSPLSTRLEEAIRSFEEKGWLDKELFFLILDKKEVVGYIGINRQREDFPFGSYLFIYALRLDAEYNNNENLGYISRFIDAIAKKEKYFNIDLTSQGCDFSIDELQLMGFTQFSSTCYLQLGQKAIMENPLDIDNYTFIKLENIQDLIEIKKLPIGRNLPFGHMLSNWLDKLNVEAYEGNISSNEEISEFVLIKGDNNDGYIKIIVLTDPITVFDDYTIKKIVTLIIQKIVKSNENQSILIPIPLEALKHFKEEVEELEVVYWFRRIIGG